MVCDEVVAIVSVADPPFFTQYTLPVMEAAVGNVRVVADEPVKIKKLSEAPAVVLEEKVVIGRDRLPLTSSVELGLAVPIPTCACTYTENTSIPITNSFFMDWIFFDFGF